jgi:3-hydroxyisobutyrate dehydrogenase-like beta-hydroxyacid dehydrogenase
MSEVGFVGLGNMGAPMAANLVRAGHAVRVYNRTASKADDLVCQGATIAATPGGTATPGGVVFSMLSNDQALEEVCAPRTGLLDTLGSGGLHVSMSTVSPATSQAMADAHARRGVAFLTAPVCQGYGKLIAEHRYEPVGFRLVLGLKDINLALQTAAAASMPMPLASLLRDRWRTSVARGRGEHDWSSVGLTAAEDAGLKPMP